MNIELTIVLHLRVVEKVSVDPHAGRRFLRFITKFFNNTGYGNELDQVGVTDNDLVEQSISGRMIVAVDEAGDDGHLPRIVGLSRLADKSLDLVRAPDGNKPATFNCKCLRLRRTSVDGIHF